MSVKPAHPPEAFASALERWFAEHRKDYPWRQTTDPYAILVAEVMLQQTQITTVLDRGYYARWLEQFPTFEALAAAEEDEVLRAWEGLGYYRRARNLHKLAKHIVDLHGGVMPREPSEILALPAPQRVGHFQAVTTGNDVSLDYASVAALRHGRCCSTMRQTATSRRMNQAGKTRSTPPSGKAPLPPTPRPSLAAWTLPPSPPMKSCACCCPFGQAKTKPLHA